MDSQKSSTNRRLSLWDHPAFVLTFSCAMFLVYDYVQGIFLMAFFPIGKICK